MKHNENTKYVKLGITGAAVLAFGFATAYILNQSANIAAGIQHFETVPVRRTDRLYPCTDVQPDG